MACNKNTPLSLRNKITSFCVNAEVLLAVAFVVTVGVVLVTAFVLVEVMVALVEYGGQFSWLPGSIPPPPLPLYLLSKLSYILQSYVV